MFISFAAVLTFAFASSRCFLDFFFVLRRCFWSDRFLSALPLLAPLGNDLSLAGVGSACVDFLATSATMCANGKLTVSNVKRNLTYETGENPKLFTFSTWPLNSSQFHNLEPLWEAFVIPTSWQSPPQLSKSPCKSSVRVSIIKPNFSILFMLLTRMPLADTPRT